MRTARIIVTYECPRNCVGCCNKQEQFKHVQPFGALEHVKEFDQIILTGGEPLIDPKRLIELISLIRHLNPTAEIIVYSALYKDNLADLLTVTYLVDGLTLTIHKPKDLMYFIHFDSVLDMVDMPRKKFRLNIFKQALVGTFYAPKWNIKRDIEWIEDCPLPRMKHYLNFNFETMSFIKPVISREPSDLFSTAFGISQERVDFFNDRIGEILKAAEEDEEDSGLTNAGIVVTFTDLAENVEEVAFLACQAGKLIAHKSNPFEELLKSMGSMAKH